MGTTREFQSMLNQFLPLELLKSEYIKRDYLMQKAEQIEDWKGGELIIAFQGQHASSVEFGQLTASNDVSRHKYIRGSIAVQPEVWSTLSWNHRDLQEHNGKIPESTFLKILPDQIDSMMMYFKMVVSTHLLGGPHFSKVTVNGTAGGVIGVSNIDRFTKDQKVTLKDSNTGPLDYYVINVSVYDETVTLSLTRGGVATTLVAYLVSEGAKVYHPGALTGGMTSLPSQLLSAVNGGGVNLFGQLKTDHEFLQCPQFSGTSISATNVLSTVFAAYTKRMQLAKGGAAPEVLMSFKHFGSCLTALETQKGTFNIIPNSRKVSVYGWDTIEIGSVSGQTLTIIAINEMQDDQILLLDWKSIKFYSNGLFKRRKSPGGIEYFEVRETTGYSYLLDHSLYGDLVCVAPWKQMVIYGIPNY